MAVSIMGNRGHGLAALDDFIDDLGESRPVFLFNLEVSPHIDRL